MFDYFCIMKVGYARVSTVEQNLNGQVEMLEQAGCETIFTDKISGTVRDRSGLDQVKAILKQGDTLVVWRLDRLGRSLIDLIEWVKYLDSVGIGLKSLHESIDTTTSTGKLVFHIFGALAEFERNLIRERTMVGLASARAKGRVGGIKKKLVDSEVDELRTLHQQKTPITQLCKRFNISRQTIYNYLN